MSAGTAGAADLDAQVLRTKLDIDFLRFGRTATVAVEVWMRPWASVAGTRCTRCTPLS
ncbi:MAG: hypothetical protein ACKOEG_01450 [Chthoniobacterales bacterium]